MSEAFKGCNSHAITLVWYTVVTELVKEMSINHKHLNRKIQTRNTEQLKATVQRQRVLEWQEETRRQHFWWSHHYCMSSLKQDLNISNLIPAYSETFLSLAQYHQLYGVGKSTSLTTCDFTVPGQPQGA